jgi:hypothetical protein
LELLTWAFGAPCQSCPGFFWHLLRDLAVDSDTSARQSRHEALNRLGKARCNLVWQGEASKR